MDTRSDGNRAQDVIAHRGASAYTPENTMAAYELALAQGATGIELDLHATSDGALVCIHDLSLERTTDVRARFPTRGREVVEAGAVARRWYVHDFTLAEILTLDAGAWFGPTFAAERVPVFDDVLDWARGRTSILAELKYPEAYEPFDVDLVSLCEAVVRRHTLVRARAGTPPLTVQSFHEPAVRRAAVRFAGRLPVEFLRQALDAVACADDRRLAEIAQFAAGLNPEKSSLELRPELATMAHRVGLRVTCWTFRDRSVGRFDNVREEMRHYLDELGVDAVITDHPDRASGLVPA